MAGIRLVVLVAVTIRGGAHSIHSKARAAPFLQGHLSLSNATSGETSELHHAGSNVTGEQREVYQGPSDGYVDTDDKHPRRRDPSGDQKGDGLNWGPDAAMREVSASGEMPEHFSALTALLGPCQLDTCASWARSCTWGLMISLGLMCWTFKNLKVVSDVYFVPSTMNLAQHLNMPPDVAGATLLAFGSSAPEFCTNVVATFFIVNECGIGDIIGSAIHNVLLVIGVSGIFAVRVLNLWWYPLSRDCLFFAISIAQLTMFLWDEHITAVEAGIMVATYGVYCSWMMYNMQIYEGVCSALSIKPILPADEDDDDDEQDGIFWWDPVEMLWNHAMPDPGDSPWKCFFASLFNIAWLSYVMVDAATRFGCIMGIPTLFMGLVFLAAGTSIPDAFASMGAAKRGQGDMAVSNALGSNIFDILMGLGFPWLLALMMGKPIVFLGVNRLLYWVAILMMVLLAFMVAVISTGWKLGARLGGGLTIMYASYVLFALYRSFHESH